MTPELRLVEGAVEGDPATVQVTGLAAETLAALRDVEPAAWPRTLAVYPDGAADDPEAPPMLGSYAVEGERAVFTPRFPFTRGMRYRARWRPSGGGQAVEIEFGLDAPPPARTTRITAVYPSVDVWPMNQLKMYLHFSASMRAGRAFDSIHLIDVATGAEVEQPFVTVQEELWDRDHTVLTVLFDPGRIKRGLVPHQQVGLPLREGGSYRLVIDPAWPDGGGQPLESGFERGIVVGAIDRSSPHPSGWTLDPPPSGTREALRVDFAESMDHGLLHTLISVRFSPGDPPSGWSTASQSTAADEIAGRIETTAAESVWSFVPERPWQPGRYEMVVPTILEDLAGNSLRSLFDVDLGDPPSEFADARAIYLPFRIGG